MPFSPVRCRRLHCLCGSAFLLVSCARKTESAEGEFCATAGVSEQTIVPVARVVRSNLASNMILTGEFVPYQEIDVMAKEAGYIKSIRVDIGDRVHTGELLAELEIPEMQDDIARADAAVQAAQAEITTAQEDVSRAQSTYDIANLSLPADLGSGTEGTGIGSAAGSRRSPLETAGDSSPGVGGEIESRHDATQTRHGKSRTRALDNTGRNTRSLRLLSRVLSPNDTPIPER